MNIQIGEKTVSAGFESSIDGDHLRVAQQGFRGAIRPHEVDERLTLLLDGASPLSRPSCVGFVIRNVDDLIRFVEEVKDTSLDWQDIYPAELIEKLIAMRYDGTMSEDAQRFYQVAMTIATHAPAFTNVTDALESIPPRQATG